MAWILLGWLWGGNSRVVGAPCEGRSQTIALHNYTILHVILWFTDAVLEQHFFDDLETTGPMYNRLYAYLILLIKGRSLLWQMVVFWPVGHSRWKPQSGSPLAEVAFRWCHDSVMMATATYGDHVRWSLWVACHVPVCNIWIHMICTQRFAKCCNHVTYLIFKFSNCSSPCWSMFIITSIRLGGHSPY